MPLVDMFRRASTYILGNDNSRINDKLINNFTKQYDDNEVLYCKNNVCVHPPLMIRNNIDVVHHPGYLTITTKIFVDQYNNSKRPTLFLTWIPNTALTKYTTTTTSMESLNSNDSLSTTTTTTNPFLMNNDLNNDSISSLSLSSSLTTDSCYNEKNTININISSPDVEILTTPDLDQKHNSTTFIDSTNSSPILSTKQQHKCHRFSVDLSQMRSLRLFFNDDHCTCGQLVIASRESQYKILHFHYGGLDHLAQVLHQWHSLLHNIKTINNSDNDDDDNEMLPFRHFMVVCRPEVSDLELHPEEGQVPKLTSELFYSLFNIYGQLDDDLTLRKTIFFNGMDRDLRKHVWPFLLHLYPYQSTYNERQQIDQLHRLEYDEITRRRLELNGKQLQQFKRHTQSVIEKDVIRTDRCNPYFMGDDDNPNLTKMKNILLNYSLYNPQLGYTQGMSDLLAPILCELNDEIMAFWCFVGLMQQRGVFIATPTDHDMDCNLKYLKELIHLLLPNFYQHLEKYKDDTASELLFVHRWILLCFKREFTESVALRIWEACWSNYLTDYFHLFICLSIISVYVDDVIRQDLCADEMLLYFSSLAMYMDGQLIIRKARGLLHQFRQLREIPCTLSDLCRKCGPGIWDSTHSPRIYCIGGGGHENNGCCNHF